MRFEPVSPPDLPEEVETTPLPSPGGALIPGDETRTALMTERAGSLGERITGIARSLESVLGRLDAKIVRYERDRVDDHAIDRSPPPENFRPELFSGGGDR